MENVVDALTRFLGDREIGEVAFDEFSGRIDRQILPASGDEAVGDTDAVPAPDQFLREMRSDESGSAGDEIGRQVGR